MTRKLPPVCREGVEEWAYIRGGGGEGGTDCRIWGKFPREKTVYIRTNKVPQCIIAGIIPTPPPFHPLPILKLPDAWSERCELLSVDKLVSQ